MYKNDRARGRKRSAIVTNRLYKRNSNAYPCTRCCFVPTVSCANSVRFRSSIIVCLVSRWIDGSTYLRPDNIITYARIRDTIGGNTIRAMGLSGRRARLFGTELGFRSTLVPRRPVKPIAFIHAYVTSISITICKLI